MRAWGRVCVALCATIMCASHVHAVDVGLRGRGAHANAFGSSMLESEDDARAPRFDHALDANASSSMAMVEMESHLGFPIEPVVGILGGPFESLISAVAEFITPDRALSAISVASRVARPTVSVHTGMVIGQGKSFLKTIVSFAVSVAAVEPFGMASNAILLITRGTAFAMGIMHYFHLRIGTKLQEEMCETGAPMVVSRSSLLWMQEQLSDLLAEVNIRSSGHDGIDTRRKIEEMKARVSARLEAIVVKVDAWHEKFSTAMVGWTSSSRAIKLPKPVETVLTVINKAVKWINENVLSALRSIWNSLVDPHAWEERFKWVAETTDGRGLLVPGHFEVGMPMGDPDDMVAKYFPPETYDPEAMVAKHFRAEMGDPEAMVAKHFPKAEGAGHIGVKILDTSSGSESEAFARSCARLTESMQSSLRMAENPSATPFYMDFNLMRHSRFGFATLYEYTKEGGKTLVDKYTGPFMLHPATRTFIESGEVKTTKESGWRFRTHPDMRTNRLTLHDTRVVHARLGATSMCMEQAWLGSQDLWKSTADGHKMSLEKFVDSDVRVSMWSERIVLFTLEPSWDLTADKDEQLLEESKRLQYGTLDKELKEERCISIRVAASLPDPKSAGASLKQGIVPNPRGHRDSRIAPMPRDAPSGAEAFPDEVFAFQSLGEQKVKLCTNNGMEAIAWYCTAARIGMNMPGLGMKESGILNFKTQRQAAVFFGMHRPSPMRHKTELQSLVDVLEHGQLYLTPGAMKGGQIESICRGSRFAKILSKEDVVEPFVGEGSPPASASASVGGAASSSPPSPPPARSGAGAAPADAPEEASAESGLPPATDTAARWWEVARWFERPKPSGDWTPVETAVMQFSREVQDELDLEKELQALEGIVKTSAKLSRPTPVASRAMGGAAKQAGSSVPDLYDMDHEALEEFVLKDTEHPLKETEIENIRRERIVREAWAKPQSGKKPEHTDDDVQGADSGSSEDAAATPPREAGERVPTSRRSYGKAQVVPMQ